MYPQVIAQLPGVILLDLIEIEHMFKNGHFFARLICKEGAIFFFLVFCSVCFGGALPARFL